MINDEQIDDYLSGKLTEQERRKIDAKILQDRQLAQFVANYTSLSQEIESAGWWQWEEAVSSAENELENQGFFLTDNELDDYLSGETEPDVTEQIERQRFNNAQFAARLETLAQVRRALQSAARLEWEALLDKAEQHLDESDFFEDSHEAITEKMPQPMPPVYKALIAVGILLLLILILRWFVFA